MPSIEVRSLKSRYKYFKSWRLEKTWLETLVMGVSLRISCLKEDGREKSKDVTCMAIKVNTLKLVRWEKASLSMLEMGLKDRSSRLRLLKFGFLNWNAEIEVILLKSALRCVSEEG